MKPAPPVTSRFMHSRVSGIKVQSSMTGPQPSTLIMIPTYNERDLVSRIVPAVRAAVPEASVLVIDDNSPDGTGDVANALAAADRKVQVLPRPGKQGLGAAYLDAFGRGLGKKLREAEKLR